MRIALRPAPAVAWLRVLGAIVLLAAAGCGSSGPSALPSGPPPSTKTLTAPPAGATPTTAAHPSAVWPTFGRDAARAGVAAGVATAGPLSISWRAHLDGAVYGHS